MYQQLIQQSTNNNPMTAAFILGGLAVAGVFAFVYFQKKNSQNQNNSNTNNGQTGVATPSFSNGDDNSSSGTGGSTPAENEVVATEAANNTNVVTEDNKDISAR